MKKKVILKNTPLKDAQWLRKEGELDIYLFPSCNKLEKKIY